MFSFLASHPKAFDQITINLLVAALDDAWDAVQASGVPLCAENGDALRSMLATHIVALAEQGERNVDHLSQGAVIRLAEFIFMTKSASVGGETTFHP